MATAIRITGGKVYDPANGVDGVVRDVLIVDGKVASRLPAALQPRVIDVTGCIVMPGGVEMHAHVASMAVNATRAIQSEAGYTEVMPAMPAIGRLYAQLGYTTVIEPAVPPGGAQAAHMQLDDMPNLDAGILLLMGNHEGLIDRIHQGSRAAAIELVRELLLGTNAFGIKAVNPAGVAAWRRDPARIHVDGIDDAIPDTKVSPRAMLELLCEAHETLGLSHPTHIHGPQLGEPGNVAITLDMLKALRGRRCHLAHLQYYCYGKTKAGGFTSAVDELLNLLGDLPQVTADLGMVAFGPAFTATADLPLEYALYKHVGSPGKPAAFCDSGNEDCFGVMPLMHTPRSASHAMQWATGLELALKWTDPWHYALTVDHPNGGSFLNYPALIALLMSKARRDEAIASVHAIATKRTGLASLSREMTLNDIAIITRAAPARALGLKDKGHLAAGADADVAVYADNAADPQAMFSQARWVIKAGQVIIADGRHIAEARGARLRGVRG